MRRCLMLDVDGVTLCDGDSPGARWDAALQADLGIDPAALKTAFFDVYWHAIIRGRRPMVPALTNALFRMHSDVPAQRLIDYWFSRYAQPDCSVLEVCTRLRASGGAVWFTTNQEAMRADYLWNRLELRGFADGMIFSAALGTCSPEPDFFRAAQRVTGRNPADHLLVDDMAVNVASAQQAGWSAVRWVPGSDLAAIVADHL